VRHFLMRRKDVPEEKIDRIMAHPQVFAQCKGTLAQKYPGLIQESGTGDLIDTAKAAYSLANGKLPDNYAILGPGILSQIYDFEVMARDLQDIENNLTSFFLVSRQFS
jgi:prephenate dehydratase